MEVSGKCALHGCSLPQSWGKLPSQSLLDEAVTRTEAAVRMKLDAERCKLVESVTVPFIPP